MDELPRPLELSQALDELREDNWAQLGVKYAAIEISQHVKIPLHFILSLAPNDGGNEPTNDQTLAVRLSLLAFYATRGHEIPNIFQLQAALASITRNSLIVAGTGFGKTHIMALLMLLEKSDSKNVFITVSPLKRLQVTQVASFLLKYGIHTVSINHDTPKGIDYWRENIHDGWKGQSQQGTAQHLIVTAEQLFKSPEGHLTPFALTLRNPAFRQRIARVNVDEIHFIHYYGMERFGIPPFSFCLGTLF
ncbi:hypothetical protein BDP27DRAFT_1363368 [Rhodocollybia butyracea]|uniref:DEAD/DEAH-box helicase domain-containing protein n=1 Tax=Rhodocollybia butyracea TaxID=206335 RepID=A0A9P5PNV7_9AGAR|nr:hypothetical protein BDP27DRAFT_1363368 [Rhodocollybia butyracea]